MVKWSISDADPNVRFGSLCGLKSDIFLRSEQCQ
jgi:hypothetical protein